jgi:intracellular multiplication protein IcmL
MNAESRVISDDASEQYVPNNNDFYKDHYHRVIMGMMALIVMMIMVVGVILYQVFHRPLPTFNAVQARGERRVLIPYHEPNLLPDTILRWASKAATIAYTFDFVNYHKQIAAVRPYFTSAGWNDYLNSIQGLISTIVKNQLFINGVVSDPPVISNQGPLPGKGYSWRVQIPFLVSYQSANNDSKRNYYVIITIIRVPTEINPQGIGIDQFVMV